MIYDNVILKLLFFILSCSYNCCSYMNIWCSEPLKSVLDNIFIDASTYFSCKVVPAKEV